MPCNIVPLKGIAWAEIVIVVRFNKAKTGACCRGSLKLNLSSWELKLRLLWLVETKS